jgi:uncharacterized protein YeaO (DUF488 family)
MAVVLTLGTTRKPLRRFIELLRGAEVDGVIDTRRNNTSQLAGFAKKEDLEFLLTEGFNTRYEHRPELAPSEPILATFQKDRDWDRYSTAFMEEIEAREMRPILRELLKRYERPCLLCACDSHERCHRRLLAEALLEERPGLLINHLR